MTAHSPNVVVKASTPGPRMGAGRSRGGARTWYFPDGYLPAKKAGDKIDAHEALMILNTNDRDAHLLIDIYFEDRDPIEGIAITIGAKRVRCIRLDWPDDLGGVALPETTQYALRVHSDINIIVQQGRVDTTQPDLSYYGSMGFWEA